MGDRRIDGGSRQVGEGGVAGSEGCHRCPSISGAAGDVENKRRGQAEAVCEQRGIDCRSDPVLGSERSGLSISISEEEMDSV